MVWPATQLSGSCVNFSGVVAIAVAAAVAALVEVGGLPMRFHPVRSLTALAPVLALPPLTRAQGASAVAAA